MKYSLRNLMIVAVLGPPLVAWGWRGVEKALSPLKSVYPCGHPVTKVDWQKGTMQVKNIGGLSGGFRSEESP